jgi:hypothetical protein
MDEFAPAIKAPEPKSADRTAKGPEGAVAGAFRFCRDFV